MTRLALALILALTFLAMLTLDSPVLHPASRESHEPGASPGMHGVSGAMTTVAGVRVILRASAPTVTER